MLTTDLDGKTTKWKMRRGRAKKSSSLHLYAYEIIREKYPSEQIIEEISIPIRFGRTVYGDIYIPGRKKLIEVHGEQHYKYNPFFFKTKGEFLKARKRDLDKKEWCNINGIEYIELPFDKKESWCDLI